MDESPPLLFMLAGKPAPVGLAQALRRLGSVRSDARAQLEEVALSSLEPLPEDQLEARMVRLCRRHDWAAEEIGPGIKGIVFLLRTAAAADVDARALGTDVMALTDDASLADLVVGVYAKARGSLRNEIVRSALLAHGKVLAGVEWRIDTVGSSDRGRKLNVPVALLTLHYQEGTRTDAITLQALPETLHALREVISELLHG